jgi:penicillin amidase
VDELHSGIELPTLFDPPSGIIVTANQRIVGTDYPYFLTHSWAQPYRARRILDLLTEKPKLSSEDFRRIQGDVYSIAGVTFAKEAVKLLRLKLTPADEKLKAISMRSKSGMDELTPNPHLVPLLAYLRIAFRSRILPARWARSWCKTISGTTSIRLSIV